eukprot:4885596-Prymnesium_polylepis.1
MLLGAKLGVDREALHLLLPAMQAQQGHAGPERREHAVQELHLLARRDEHDRLREQVGLDERPDDVNLLRRRHDHVMVLQPRGRGVGRVLVDANVLRLAQREAGERAHVARLRRREEERLARARQAVEDGGEGGLEAEVEDA